MTISFPRPVYELLKPAQQFYYLTNETNDFLHGNPVVSISSEVSSIKVFISEFYLILSYGNNLKIINRKKLNNHEHIGSDNGDRSNRATSPGCSGKSKDTSKYSEYTPLSYELLHHLSNDRIHFKIPTHLIKIVANGLQLFMMSYNHVYSYTPLNNSTIYVEEGIVDIAVDYHLYILTPEVVIIHTNSGRQIRVPYKDTFRISKRGTEKQGKICDRIFVQNNFIFFVTRRGTHKYKMITGIADGENTTDCSKSSNIPDFEYCCTSLVSYQHLQSAHLEDQVIYILTRIYLYRIDTRTMEHTAIGIPLPSGRTMSFTTNTVILHTKSGYLRAEKKYISGKGGSFVMESTPENFNKCLLCVSGFGSNVYYLCHDEVVVGSEKLVDRRKRIKELHNQEGILYRDNILEFSDSSTNCERRSIEYEDIEKFFTRLRYSINFQDKHNLDRRLEEELESEKTKQNEIEIMNRELQLPEPFDDSSSEEIGYFFNEDAEQGAIKAHQSKWEDSDLCVVSQNQIKVKMSGLNPKCSDFFLERKKNRIILRKREIYRKINFFNDNNYEFLKSEYLKRKTQRTEVQPSMTAENPEIIEDSQNTQSIKSEFPIYSELFSKENTAVKKKIVPKVKPASKRKMRGGF